MDKYGSLYKDIYSVFGSVGWATENIKTLPDNFVGTAVGNEYIRVSIVSGGESATKALNAVSGQLMIDIFVPAGEGSNRTNAIAGRLDSYLSGKYVKTTNLGSTQFGISTLTPFGNDKVNPALYRSILTIPFNFYGVQ